MKTSPVAICGALLASLVLGACSMTPMMPANSPMVARLSGTNEVPSVPTNGNGTAEISFDKQTKVMAWTVNYSGLTGPATGAHFHGPAAISENAGVVVPLTGSLASPISGSATLTDAQAADLMAGKWYFNVHTAANPGGEIRGQVNVAR